MGIHGCVIPHRYVTISFVVGMICFPARLRRANSVDSFVVPLLPAAQSALSVATTTNGRSLSLESIPLLDTVPLLRAEEQPGVVATSFFKSSLQDQEHSDTTSTDSSLSETEKETEKKESTTSVATEVRDLTINPTYCCFDK